jgi:hypothetical protein
MTATSDECEVCGKPHPWPDGTTPKHPFNGVSDSKAWLGNRNRADAGKSASRGSDGAVRVATDGWPFDPVLRQALIDKGVLTPDDLRAAETKIQEMSVIFNQGAR